MKVLVALSPHACLPWSLAIGLIYYLARSGRVVETVKVAPVVGDKEAMLRYCAEVEQAGGGKNEIQKWQAQMIREGAHTHILRALQDFQETEDAALARRCLGAICSVARANALTQNIMMHAKALKVVMSTALGFFFDPDVMGNASSTIGCLCDKNWFGRERLMQLGGPQFAVDTWQRHPDHKGAIYGACYMIASMVDGYVPTKRMLAFEMDFTQLGLDSIRRFPKTEDLVRAGVMEAFSAIAGMPALQDVQEKLAEDGVLEAVAQVLRENGDGMATVSSANRVVQSMGLQNITYRHRMVQSGIADLIVGRLGAFGTQRGSTPHVDPDMTGIQALVSLAMNADENKKHLVELGVVEKVESVMKLKSQHGGLQGVGTKLLNMLKGAGGGAAKKG
eukprot:CAMPEP_0204599728 /NCGR_PEP_ID=MMETSP0661-20131031/55005_1 /ASSEMBLY_ACC=CAM_ASM_000606 /TAXON_ID=109239 /ORGANISM="Alexandrium margalefi, Strain AMGDE01CS-322" /LENGTH=391 /DNA_ID=CAMNT_0051610477 /DNA_START=64 /DNA_END=1239 /DNA_ORIENTATION=+